MVYWKSTHLAAVAGLPSAIGDALLPRARALALGGVVLDWQLVAGQFGGRVQTSARIAVVVHGALHRHGRACVDASVVV